MVQFRDKKLLILIALKIKSIRQSKGITQEEFYNDTGIHIARIETGKLNLSISTLKQICDYFDLSLCEFFKEFED